MATGAGAVTSIDVRPYLGNTVGIGTTVPGDPDSVLCLVFQDGAVPAYGGKVNGVVVPSRTGELNVNLKAQDLITAVPTCTATAINISTVDATNIAIQGAKPGGTLQISTAASVQPGINATATTTVRVNYDTGQSVKLVSGATVVGGALVGDNHVDMKLKPVATITKASLNQTSCTDNQYLIDTNTPDGSKSNGPTATKIDLVDPSSTDPALGDAGVYVATIRDCAENTATVPGKASTVKIAVVGAGTANVQFLNSSTDNPAVWDTTRGASCSAAKYGVNTVTASILATRTVICKGDYGTPIPLSLTVRTWLPNVSGQKDSYGVANTDADGGGPIPAVALHAGPPVTILSHTFS